MLSGEDEELDWWMRYQIRLQSRKAWRGPSEEAPAVRVAAERRLNAIVVSGPTPVLALAEEVISGLDVDPDDGPGGPGGGRIVKVITLTNADAADLADSLEAVLADDGTGGTPPTMRVDASSNSLIVSASPGQLALIEGLAKQLDSATMTSARQMRTLRLDRSRSDAGVVAKTLQRILREQGGVEVEVIDASELLEREEEEEETSSLDGAMPMPRGGLFGIVRDAVVSGAFAAVQDEATDADAADDVSVPTSGTQSLTEKVPAVTIAVDPATNSLIFMGSERLTGRLTELARELERQAPAEPLGVRVVKLPDTADARSVTNLINQTVRQVGRVSDSNPSGFTGRVAVSPDPDAGAVIVWANDTDFETVSSLIAGVARLDRSAELTIKVYPLVNIDGRGAVRSVQDLFSTNPRGRQGAACARVDAHRRGARWNDARGHIRPRATERDERSDGDVADRERAAVGHPRDRPFRGVARPEPGDRPDGGPAVCGSRTRTLRISRGRSSGRWTRRGRAGRRGTCRGRSRWRTTGRTACW